MKEIEIDDLTSLGVHPAAALFPMLEQAELEELAADIHAHGQKSPIVVHQGMILDGRNRLKACELADMRPRFEEWDNSGSIVDFVFSCNLHRRHLSASQRALLVAKKVELCLAETQQRLGARSARPEDERGSIRDKAAGQAQIGATTVHRAQTVLEKGVPELVAKVAAGEVRVGTALEIASLPPDEQREVVRERREVAKAKELRAARMPALPRPPAPAVSAAQHSPGGTPAATPASRPDLPCNEVDFDPLSEEDPIRVAVAAPIALPEFRRKHRRGDTAKDEAPALALIVEATRSALYAWRFLNIEWEEDQRWDMDFARKEGAQVSRLLGQALAHLEVVGEIASGKRPVPPRGDA